MSIESRVVVSFTGTVDVLLTVADILAVGGIEPTEIPAGITAVDLWELIVSTDTFNDASTRLRDHVEDRLAGNGHVTFDFGDPLAD